jgi:histidyl-tRNA synthetase
MTIAQELRQVGVSVDFDAKADKKPRKQLDVAVKYAKTVVYLKEDDTKPDLPGRVRIKTLEVENLTEKDLENAGIPSRGDLVYMLRPTRSM